MPMPMPMPCKLMMGASSWYTATQSPLRLPEHVSLVAMHACSEEVGGLRSGVDPPQEGAEKYDTRTAVQLELEGAAWAAMAVCAPPPRPPPRPAGRRGRRAHGIRRRRLSHPAEHPPPPPPPMGVISCPPAPLLPASQPSRCCVGLMQRARHARRCVCVLPQAWQSGGGGQTLLPARMPNGSRLSSGVPTHRIVRGGGGGGGAGPCLPSS
eukprot:COSAG01_NODE_3559_length_5935_cov_2.330535_4_plen_210_part_00